MLLSCDLTGCADDGLRFNFFGINGEGADAFSQGLFQGHAGVP
jgi:hypothetical protein